MSALATAEASVSQEKELQDTTERGLALYDTRLKETLERDQLGKIVVIHPDSGDYLVADNSQAAMREMKERHPHGFMVVTRIGPPLPADLRRLDRWQDATPRREARTSGAAQIK